MLTVRSEARGFIRFGINLLYGGLAAWSAVTFAQTIQPGAPYPVGMKQLEYFAEVLRYQYECATGRAKLTRAAEG